MDSYAQKLKTQRELKGLTQEAVAQALDITRPTYNAIETGKRELTINELHRLCGILDTTLERFLFSSTQEAPYENRMTNFKQLILNCLHYGSGSINTSITKKKLAALVYISDFAAYYENHKSLSRLPYRHTEQGPIVDAYYRMIDELYDEGAISIELRGRAIVISANEPSAPKSTLSDDEVNLIKEVSTPWSKEPTEAVIRFIKDQAPWKTCTQGEIIPYDLILNEIRNPFRPPISIRGSVPVA